MIRKLHLQMTLFCTLITGAILLGLSLLCLLAAEKSVRNNCYASFSKELSVLLTSLQSQPYLSHQWLGQMQEEHHLKLYFYNNGESLFYEALHEDKKESGDLPRQVLDTARSDLGLDIFQNNSGQRILHEEFPFQDYYASVGFLELSGGRLSFVILYPLSGQHTTLRVLGLFILLTGFTALVLLGLFAWFFTGRLLRPITKARERQTQFIASASHELRTPLGVILSGLESMEKSESVSDRRHFAAMIRREGRRMKGLIDSMLLLASSDSHSLCLHLTVVQPDELLLECYERYEGLASDQSIRLSFSLPQDPLPDCCWDRDCIQQILSILMDNALAYTPAGGRIHLSLSFRERGRLLFGVTDSGPGIPVPERERIFERFYRSDQSRADKSHFGLGLATAKELVNAHQGRIWVSEGIQPGLNGAAFWVELGTNDRSLPA